MRQLLAVLALALSQSAYSFATNHGVSCVPRNGASAVSVWRDDKNVTLKILNLRGYSGMPQFEEGMSEQNIPFLKMQVEDLRPLGNVIEYKWTLAQCTWDEKDNRKWSCGGDAVTTATHGIENNSLNTSIIKEESLSASYEKVLFRTIFHTQGNYYFVAIPFYMEQCKAF
jgi:hypothetical protein